MEKLGIKFSNDNDFRKSIDKAGIAILHAPLPSCYEKMDLLEKS
jgi:hypothetical protein